MPQIQLATKKEYQDIINATFLYIESVTEGNDVYVIIFYENGRSEKQEIVAGSKFTVGREGQRIWKVNFVNPSLNIINISYRYSVVYGYDESRLYGDVNSTIINDYRDDKSASSESFVKAIVCCGDTTGPAFGESWGFGQMWNPAGSGKKFLIDQVIATTSALYLEGVGDVAAEWFELIHALDTVEGTENPQGGALVVSYNKLSGGGATVARFHGGGYNVPVPYAGLKRFHFQMISPGKAGTWPASNVQFDYKNPPIIMPGYGYSVYMGGYSASAKTGATRVTCHYREVAI